MFTNECSNTEGVHRNMLWLILSGSLGVILLLRCLHGTKPGVNYKEILILK